MKVSKPAISMKEVTGTALSRREAWLLAGWERQRQTSTSLTELRKLVGSKAATLVAHRLMKKGVLLRLGGGEYYIRPMRSHGRPTAPSTPVVASLLLRARPYYLGGLWAVWTNGLSSQVYATVIDAFVERRLAPRSIGPGRVRFHALPSVSFDYGITASTIEGHVVKHSDLERTLLDALDHPRVFDGIDAAVERLDEQFDKARISRLVDYAAQGSSPSTCQRVGVIAERHGVSPRRLAPLLRKARSTQSLLSMVPSRPRTATLNAKWSVIENDR